MEATVLERGRVAAPNDDDPNLVWFAEQCQTNHVRIDALGLHRLPLGVELAQRDLEPVTLPRRMGEILLYHLDLGRQPLTQRRHLFDLFRIRFLLRRIADEPVGSEELEKSRNLAKGRFLLQRENPQGMIMFGLRREVLEGEAVDPQEIQEGLDAVTAEDIQRVAQDVIGGNGLNLALIGPFDEAGPFERLLA